MLSSGRVHFTESFAASENIEKAATLTPCPSKLEGLADEDRPGGDRDQEQQPQNELSERARLEKEIPDTGALCRNLGKGAKGGKIHQGSALRAEGSMAVGELSTRLEREGRDNLRPSGRTFGSPGTRSSCE